MRSDYDLLISKINEFTRKFYLNSLLKGSIYTATLVLAYYLMLSVMVYYFQPQVWIKTAMFFSFLLVAAGGTALWMLRPGLKYVKLTKGLSDHQAAEIIGSHFEQVKDKLLNTLQLRELVVKNPGNSQLVLASIDQKIKDLRPIPFSSAIRLEENRKYLKYLLVPSSVIFFLLMVAPTILQEGTSSLVRYNQLIVPKAPFEFRLMNKKLIAVQGQDINIEVKLNGNQLPQDVYVTDGAYTYKLEKKNNTLFQYTFKNLQKNKSIHFQAEGFNSATHLITVKPRPLLLNIKARLHFPAYLKKKDELIAPAGDLILQEGTLVTWDILTKNSSTTTFILGNKRHVLQAQGARVFTFTATLKQSVPYQISSGNRFAESPDSISHQVSVIKDEYPQISVTEVPDSLSSRTLYFSGKITDDHGFSALKFHYVVTEGQKKIKTTTTMIPFDRSLTQSSFLFPWKIEDSVLRPGQTVTYFFEVGDNDGVNGAKFSKTSVSVFEIPTAHEVARQLDERSADLKDQMARAIRLAGKVEKDSKRAQEMLLNKKTLTLDDKKQIQQVLEEQKSLEKAVEEIKKLNEKNNIEKEENNAINDELKHKQEQINHLFDQVLDQKTKDLLEKLQHLLEENSKNQTQNELSRMQLDNKSLKTELDRILELYKQLEFEQALDHSISMLKELASKQEDLSKEHENKGSKTPEISEQQELIAEEFKKWAEEFKNIQEKNQALERPNQIEDLEEEMQDIQKEQQQSSNMLHKNQSKEAAGHQQAAAKKMAATAKKIEEMKANAAQQENKLNEAELRELLGNLLKSSFDQEKVMTELKNINANDPLYVSKVQSQQIIKDNLKTLGDSLVSLSRRVPQLEKTVSDEMQKINFNIDQSLETLSERNTASAGRYQQYAMTSINNLSLMLNEVLSQLQKSKNNPQSGSGQEKSKSLEHLKKMQQELSNNMEKARKQMEQNSNKGTVPKGQMSQEFAKLAQQQQLVREALEKLNNSQKGGGENLNQTVQQMKMTEKDLVNKKIEEETLLRQKNILQNLLEAEKSARQQDEDAKRQSKAPKNFPPQFHDLLQKINIRRNSQMELIQKLPPGLNDYYKTKIPLYFELLNSKP